MVPQELGRLLREGASLSEDDAEALERDVEQRPDNIDTRARLLGYYEARGREMFEATTMQGKISWRPANTSVREAVARHALWLAANAPRAPLAAHPLLQFSTKDAVYSELSSIWRRQVACDPPDPTVYANAIAFFWWPNEIFADELLARADELFPGDRRWLEFRQRRRAQELDIAFSFRPLQESVRGHSGDAGERATQEPGETGLDEIEQLLREGDPESEWVPRLREIAGELSFALGRIEKARDYAAQMVTGTSFEAERGYTDAVHNGHLLLGRIALRENDVERARAELILAANAGATRMVPIVGPDMRLAAGLLAHGEREVVIRYLSRCRAFWRRGPIDEWIVQIRAGSIPDFRRILKAE
jgi:hypothetical protein